MTNADIIENWLHHNYHVGPGRKGKDWVTVDIAAARITLHTDHAIIEDRNNNRTRRIDYYTHNFTHKLACLLSAASKGGNFPIRFKTGPVPLTRPQLMPRPTEHDTSQ